MSTALASACTRGNATTHSGTTALTASTPPKLAFVVTRGLYEAVLHPRSALRVGYHALPRLQNHVARLQPARHKRYRCRTGGAAHPSRRSASTAAAAARACADRPG
eukprot:6089449-Pleurochrysis_carterae.AAC.3